MLLTETQLHEVRAIIADYHQAFIVNAIGADAVTPDVLQGLKDKGLVNVKVNSIEDAYLYGHLLAMMDDPAFATMTYEQFKQHVQKNPIPLNQIEQQAVKFATHQAAQHVKGLGNRIDVATGTILIEADAAQRARLRDTIKSKTAENISRRESVKKLKSELGWATKDWARDWDRIAITEKQNAMQRGVADHYAKRYGGDVLVAKRPMPDACKHCKRLHLGPDGQPRIFKLAELEANGTNVGRKAQDWLPVVGTVHPHCQCQMVRVPEGWGFDAQGSLIPGGEYGVHYENEEELQLAMLQEMDLQKAFKLAGRTKFQGIPIAIENKVGSVRKWQDGAGGEGSTKMLHAYGYIERTNGADEDEVDVFLGPDPNAKQAYVVHQRNVQTDVYDEDKCMLGFSNKELALEAYVQNYNRPDFAITCTAMDMDAFKRWVKSTEAKPGEMFKSGTGGLRYVVTEGMEKGEKLNSTVAATQSPSAGSIGNPSPGTSMNYVMNVPAKQPAEPVEGIKEVLDELSQNTDDAVKRDKETYDFDEPMRHVFPMVIPENFHGEDEVGTGKTEERRKNVDRFHMQNVGVTKNTVEVEDQAKPDLEKANVTPPGGTTPGGYKKVPDGKGGFNYVKEEPKAKSGSGVQSFAVFHGGKVTQHKDDADVTVLKVLKANTPALKKFRVQHGIAADVVTGGKYAMLFITKDELAKLKAYTPKQKETKKKSSAPTIEPTIPVDGSTVKRLGEIKTLQETDLEPPPVHAGVLQRGHLVNVTIDGKKVTEPLAGYDMHGKPVVFHNGKRHILEWSGVAPAAEHEYKPTFSGLTEGALVAPSAEQKKLVKEVMALKVVGEHKADEYTTWLHTHGQETFLVGGIVRDLVAGTSPISDLTHAQVLETMQDVDIVSTAHPTMARMMMNGVSPDVHESGITNDILAWGVLRSVGLGVGLDFSSMAAHDGIHSEDPTWDHNLEEDTTRRDFTCNALYYDTHNNVIIDPTGVGVADAQNKVLRLAPSPEDAKLNRSLHIRFWKFRVRGYAPEAETLKHVRKQADHWWTQLKSKPKRIAKDMYKAIGKSGDPAKNLEDFKNVMIADGCGDLYDKHLKPLEAQIIAYAKKKGPEDG